MNKKKICSILLSISGILLCSGVIDNRVYAKTLENEIKWQKLENNKGLVEGKQDYSIKVDKSVEKQGVKFSIQSVTASKNKLEVDALIESNTPFTEKSFDNEIIQMTIKNSEYENYSFYSQKVNDKTMKYKFFFNSIKGFNENLDLRFDAAFPVLDINTWVNANVDISDSINKIVEIDLNFNFANREYYKFTSDTLETSLCCRIKEKDMIIEDESYDDYVDSRSILLLKHNGKLYELNEGYSYNEDDDTLIAENSTLAIKYGDVVNNSEISIVPIKCNIKRSEMEKLYENYDFSELHKIEKDENNKVKYNNNFIFSDNTSGSISKIERDKDRVRLYCSSDSEKKSLLMAIGYMGWYDYDNNEEYMEMINEAEISKVIYKNPEDENGYIVEFINVAEGIPFSIESNDVLLGLADKYEICNEIQIK